MYSSLQIEKLSKEAKAILKDNYDSLVYCKNMLVALDDMNSTVMKKVFASSQSNASSFDSNLFEQSKSIFEKNLNAEKNNITEVHEAEYVGELDASYSKYLDLSSHLYEKGASSIQYFGDLLPTYFVVRDSIVKTNDVNMQAVERKNQSTALDASNMIISMVVIGTICILLAFFYFWYFPFYVSNTISYLAKRMKELLQKSGIKLDTRTQDEAFVLLHSIDLLENKIVPTKKSKRKNEA
jgi:hypothetical protein